MDNTCHHHHNHECSTSGSHKTCVLLVPIFNHLEVDQMEEIMATVQSVPFKKGELIYHAGDRSDSLYIVHKGKVKIYRLSETGKEQLVRILNPGDFTGELALFRNDLHESFAEAMTNTMVCTIHQADLQDLLVKYPSISLKILAEFSKRLDQSEKQTTRFATEKVETRIALFLVECLKDSQTKEFILPMSKKNLASFLGTTPETISRKLAEFENQGLIKQKPHKRIEIVNQDELLLI
ncbi:Crp/Fnr family transcriptional regulator [Bacillus sp. ISL-18]|uniref:Crp/Fnr family transcriptional regulator n=1 Tax=Bacillus sp. ISL-18 TaxID=2819118 RepID=UPI001BE7B4C2|nr:Crp/Fnr family transcriptional regulator [Bacillus sp. ISL-18]MBT2656108.1 Crp/Fnr family transcriptional regulator [Bacillus sp. ISL-18]